MRHVLEERCDLCQLILSIRNNLPLILFLILALIFCTSIFARGQPISIKDHNLQAEIESKLDLGNQNVEETAVTMARDYPGEFSINQVNAIYRALVKGWYYYNDPIYKDSYKNANKTLQDGKIAGTVGLGDCDDFAILISSQIQSLGGSTRIVFAQDVESEQGHAYAELYLGKKDDPRIEDLERWVKNEYGVASIPGLSYEDEDVWINLDYNSSYLGGPFFGGEKAFPETVWESKNKSSPKTVPVIDSMDSIEGWKNDSSDGSNIQLGSVPGSKKNATQISFDVKKDGWVGISKEIESEVLNKVLGLSFSYICNGGQHTLELRLDQEDGTAFGASWVMENKEAWTSHQIRYEDLKFIPTTGRSQRGASKVNLSSVRRLEFRVLNDANLEDLEGSITLDEVRGVMAVPVGSPWDNAERQRQRALASNLAIQSESLREQGAEMLPRSVLLALESMRMYPTVEGDQALRKGLSLLPRRIASLEHGALPVGSITFSGNGKLLLTVAKDGKARVWDWANQKKLTVIEKEDMKITKADFNPDGNLIVAAYEDGNIIIWDWLNNTEKLRLPKQRLLVNDAKFSPDGRLIATACWDGFAIIWDLSSGKEINRLPHDEALYHLEFSPDGKLLATACKNGIATVWDLTAKDKIAAFDHGMGKYQMDISSISFSSDGKLLATSSIFGGAKIWDLKTKACIATADPASIVGDVAFSPKSDLLATAVQLLRSKAGSTSKIWSIQNGVLKEIAIMNHDSSISCLAFSSDGKFLATSCDDGYAYIWDLASPANQIIDANDSIRALDFSHNGTYLASTQLHGSIIIWDWANRTKEQTIFIHDDVINDIEFSPDDKLLAIGYGGGFAKVWYWTERGIPNINSSATYERGFVDIWDWENNTRTMSLPIEDGLLDLEFNTKGNILAAADRYGHITLWDLGKNVGIGVLSMDELLYSDTHQYHDPRLYKIEFSPDGTLLAGAYADGYLAIWDWANESLKYAIRYDDDVTGVSFSPDGKRLVVACWNGTISSIELRDPLRIASVHFEFMPVNLEFNPKYKNYFAVIFNDLTSRIWDLNNNTEVVRVYHNDLINDVEFSPDGRVLATAGDDGRIQLTRWGQEDIIADACSHLTRNLTEEEWRKYLPDEPYRHSCGCEEYATAK